MSGSAHIRVRYAETDQMGVVYHGNYFVWFEVGRVELLRQVGWSYKTLEADGVDLPVIEATCQYRHPARYDDELEIRTTGRMASAVRVEFTYELVRRSDARRARHGADAARTGQSRRAALPPAGGAEGDLRVKALVTGAAGFIGSTLADRLLAEGATVVGIDCFTDYYPRALKEPISRRAAVAAVHVRRGDLQDVDLDDAARRRDAHLSPGGAGRRPQELGPAISASTSNNNIAATQRLLEACAGRPLERFVYASTSSVYGDEAAIPMREEQRLQPLSPYGVTKLAAEHLGHLYHVNYGLPFVALRYFTVYGPRQRPDMGFHRFLTAAIDGRPMMRYGDGEQTRDFTFVGRRGRGDGGGRHDGRAGTGLQHRWRVARHGESTCSRSIGRARRASP